MAETSGEGYISPKKGSKTSDPAQYQKKTVAEQFSIFIERTPAAKLYLVLAMLVYGISVYSKGKQGMKQDDIALLIFFLIFVLLSIVFLDFATFLYRQLLRESASQENIFLSIFSFLKRYLHPVLISIVIFTTISLTFYYSGRVILSILHSLNILIR